MILYDLINDDTALIIIDIIKRRLELNCGITYGIIVGVNMKTFSFTTDTHYTIIFEGDTIHYPRDLSEKLEDIKQEIISEIRNSKINEIIKKST